MVQPNGLAFSPDETSLYVVDSGRTMGPQYPAQIRRFDLAPDGTPSDRGPLVEATVGLFDGIRVDDAGRIWAGSGNGVQCHAPDGTLLGRIVLGRPVINLCFGGPRRNILYMCTPDRLLRVPVRARGADLLSHRPGGADGR
jgi:gluconolactonase